MKKKISVFLAGIMAALLLVVAGCSSNNQSQYVGTWAGTTAELKGVQVNMTEFFGNFDLTLEKDGKASILIGQEKSDGKWELSKDGKVVIDESMEFTPKDDKLVCEYAGVTITFEKKEPTDKQ